MALEKPRKLKDFFFSYFVAILLWSSSVPADYSVIIRSWLVVQYQVAIKATAGPDAVVKIPLRQTCTQSADTVGHCFGCGPLIAWPGCWATVLQNHVTWCYMSVVLIDWFVHWLIDWLIYLLVDWFVHSFLLIHWFVHYSLNIHRLIDLFIYLFIQLLLTHSLYDSFIEWFIR